MLHEAVERGIASGQVRDDIDARRLSEILLHTGNAAVHTTILQTGNESPDDVWAFCLGAFERRCQRPQCADRCSDCRPT